MKIIPFSTAVSATATSSNSLWPVSNVLDPIIKKRWQAASSTVNTASITVIASGTIDTITVHGIAADEITITVSDPGAIVWESGTVWESGIVWGIITVPEPQLIMLEPLAGTSIASTDSVKAAAWLEMDKFTGSCSVTVTVSNTTGRSMTLSIGSIVIGEQTNAGCAEYGLSVNAIDYSIEREMSGGNIYYKARDLVREFSIQLSIIDRDIFDAMWVLIRRYKRVPMPMMLIDDYGSQWLIMGRIKSMNGSLASYGYTPINLVAREEI